jgi:hypothetical protein
MLHASLPGTILGVEKNRTKAPINITDVVRGRLDGDKKLDFLIKRTQSDGFGPRTAGLDPHPHCLFG